MRVLLIALLLYAPGAIADETLPLSSLKPGCTLHTEWVGLVWKVKAIAVLQCGEEKFVVRTPMSFIGHVQIDTPEKALEFVRLFTSWERYTLFDSPQQIEIARDVEHDPYSVDGTRFDRWLAPPKVEERSNPCRPELPYMCGKEFAVTRDVIACDDFVYELHETVWERGVYMVSMRKKLFPARKLGLSFIGDY